MDAIALRDEVLRLKAALRECCEERELFRAQHRRLEHEADRKDRHITDLLAAGHITVSTCIGKIKFSGRKPWTIII